MLADIVSRLLWSKLRDTKSFYSSNGNRIDSYAQNPIATAAWFEGLTKRVRDQLLDNQSAYIWLLNFIKMVLLEPRRELRPSAAQIVKRLQHSRVEHTWIGMCCMNTYDISANLERHHQHVALANLPWPALTRLDLAHDLTTVILNMDLRILASNDSGLLQDNVWAVAFDSDGIDLLRYMAHLVSSKSPAKNILEESEVPFAQFAKALYIACTKDAAVTVAHLRLKIGWEPPKTYLVQIMAASLQLERQPLCGAPFLALLFDPLQTDNQPFGGMSIGAQPIFPDPIHPGALQLESQGHKQELLCLECSHVSTCQSEYM